MLMIIIKKLCLAFIIIGALLGAASAQAIPVLQLYIENGEFDAVSESWTKTILVPDPIRLWVIGNVGGPGGHGTITGQSDSFLRLVLATETESILGGLSLQGSTTGGFGGFTDPSTPSDGVAGLSGTGSHPVLPPHDIFSGDINWQEFKLPEMNLTDSPIANFDGGVVLPTPGANPEGQIHVYSIPTSDSLVGSEIHFDAYGYTMMGRGKKMFWKAPFSHDAFVANVPEPATYVILASFLVFVAIWRYRRERLYS